MITQRARNRKVFEELKKAGVEINDVAEALSNNQRFDKDGFYLGPEKKTIVVNGKHGKTVALRHGGSVTVFANSVDKKRTSHDSTSFWGGVIAGLLFLGDG